MTTTKTTTTTMMMMMTRVSADAAFAGAAIAPAANVVRLAVNGVIIWLRVPCDDRPCCQVPMRERGTSRACGVAVVT